MFSVRDFTELAERSDVIKWLKNNAGLI